LDGTRHERGESSGGSVKKESYYGLNSQNRGYAKEKFPRGGGGKWSLPSYAGEEGRRWPHLEKTKIELNPAEVKASMKKKEKKAPASVENWR